MLNYNPPFIFIRIAWILSTILLILIIYYLINIGNNYVSDKRKIKLANKKLIPIIIGISFLLFFFSIINKYTIVWDILYTIIFSAIIAYLFNPLINLLENKGIRRSLGVTLLYLSFIGFFAIFAFLVIPKSGAEIKRLVTNMPIYIENISEFTDTIYEKYYHTMGELPPIFQGVQQIALDNLVTMEHFLMEGLKAFIGGIFKTFSKLVSLILTPILTFYFLVDKDYFKEKFFSLVPKNHKQEYLKLFKDMDKSLSKFVRGKLILAAYVGMTTFIILLILKVEFASVIGFITGVADIIPYIGPFLGFAPAIFFAYLDSPIKAIWIGVLFILIQWVENNILAPKIIGDTTGIHPLIILISIIIGGGVFGVLGMILAVPVVAVSLILFKFINAKIKGSYNR